MRVCIYIYIHVCIHTYLSPIARTQVGDALLKMVRMKLPEDLRSSIRRDVIDIGNVVASLCPWSDTLIFKIEVMGENCCSRWHRDNYCARAIVTYNSVGTVYAPDDIVNFWELDYCGCNDKIIKDESQVCSVGVADVFFMKGSLGLQRGSQEQNTYPAPHLLPKDLHVASSLN